MGAKKKRQESDWQEHDRLSVLCRPVDANNDDESDVCPDQQYSNHDLKCSSCCNSSNCNTSSNVRENDELTRQNSVYSNHSFSINLCSSRKFCHLLSSNVFVVTLIFLIASYNIVQVESVCVWQGGGGFKVACGFRQSGLFRLRSIGGIKGYVGAGFTIGDEDGFKDSLTNTEGHHHQPQPQGGYLPTHVHTQRSLPAGQHGQIGQFSQIQEHPMPPFSGDPNTQSQQQFQYLETIQDQLAVDHQNLELKAADQRSQKMLEQQLYAQGMPMPPSPTPTAKVKRAGGLTKRASLWNWPNIFGRGKNKENGHGKSKKQKNHDFHGQPQRHHGPPPNRRSGPPPHKNKPGPPPRFDRPGKNGPPRKDRFPNKQGRRGPGGPNKFPPRPPNNNKENFMDYMKNPFSHLQENFIGKNSQENRRMHNIEQEQNHNFNKNFASGQPPHFPQQNNAQQNQFQQQQQHQQQQQSSQFGGSSQQMPPLLMMPPAGPPSDGSNYPQFKKIPNNLNPNGNDYEDAPEFHQQDQQQHHPQQNSPIDRMMQEHEQGNEPTDYYNNSPEAQFQPEREDSADPAGLKMLKRTENFGTIFHLMNPDGAPVNMQFEKQPVLPPNLQFSSQQQQDLAEELLMPNPDFDASGAGLGSMNMNDDGGGGIGGGELENPLATAVYDPNVFPDIYFTTTEKHHQQQELMNHNMLGGAPYPMMSQEMLENPLLQGNSIKRILGSSENKPRSSEQQQQQQHLQRRLKHRKKVRPHLRSNEQVSSDTTSTEAPTVVPRRKMRRRKKFRVQQANNNQVDTSEPELTGSDNAVMPKRRRKGKRKKYKLQTAEPTLPSSTERMGLAADGGEQTSVESKTETPTPELLTTTPSPQPKFESLLPTVSSSENKIKSEETTGKRGKTKTSFSLPSKEEVQTPSLEVVASPSSETKMETTTMRRTTSTEETTTQTPFSFSPFGYQDALRGGKEKQEDYDSFSDPSEGEFFYDPRYPPDHEVNRGTQGTKNMTKFIRPRGPYQGSSTTSTSTSTQSPFILYDMMGTRNQSRFSSRFDKGTSSFRLDTDDTSSAGAADNTARVGAPYGHNQHPFYANNKMHPETNDKGVFLKFDSNEWANNDQKSQYHKKPDPFSHHYNRTSTNSGYYGGSKEFRPSAELPSSLMGWERHLQTTTPPIPSPVYPRFSSENKSKFSQKSSSVEHGLFGPTMETFGPPRTTTTPFSPESGERGNKQRKLHKNLFGGSSADVSDAGNWASPNFWGSLQDSDRYAPNSDFDRNNNLKRLVEFGDPNGLKEMHPVDLSSPTPLPMPSPSPPQNTAEELDSDYYLSPSTPGTRWGKQRRRKGKPTAAPTTPSSAPFVSTIRPFPTSTTTAIPPKWLAVMSNEVDGPAEYYDNLDPNMSLPPVSSSLENNLKINAKGKNEKSGIEIKFKSGEERDPEEEADNKAQEIKQQQQTNATKPAPQQNFNLLGFPTNANNGFPGMMVHDFDASSGYGFGEEMKGQPPQAPPPSSEISYFPPVNNANRREQSVVPSGPTGPPSSVLFPPVNNPFGPNKNDPNHQRPVYPGRNPNHGNRNDYDPSSEDDMSQQNSGLPSHNDNPFKSFEKQTQVNSGMGFVSANHEFKEMNDQIQKFSTIPDSFLRRDSSEKHGGHPPNMNGEHEHEYAPPGEAPPNGMDEIPGFLNIQLPEMNPSPSDPTFNDGQRQQIHHPAQFAPSGFSHDFRDHEMPSGLEQFPPSMPPGMGNENGPPPGMKDEVRLHGDNPQDIQWDFRPLEDNNVEPVPQYHRPVPVETTTRHPMLHLDLVNGNSHVPPPPQGPPPMGPEGNFRGPPMMIRDERPPLNVRDEPFRPPPGPLRQPPPFHEEHNKLPPRDDRGPPPPPMRNENHGRPPPPRRDEPHGRPPPPPPRRDEPQRRPPPPPLIRDGRPPPPPHREHERPPPPHREHERPPPPHREHERPPPPHREHERPPPPPHREHERPPPPPHREHERPPPPPLRQHERPPPPPQREHERPPPPPQREHERPPPPHRDHERPPPQPGRRGPPPQNHHNNPEHDKPNFPPHRGPQQHPPPSRQHDNRPKPGAFFYPPSKEDSFIFDKDRRNFLDQHKTIESLRPPTRNEGRPGQQQQQRGDQWQEDQGRNPGLPRIPPTPQGMPNFLDIQKVPKDQQPKSNAQNPFLHKPPHVKPNNIPPQIFKPPPPPPPKQNFFTSLLTGPFGKPNNNNPPPPPKNNRPQQLPPPPHRPPPNHNHQQRQPNHPPPKEHKPDPFARIPFHNNNRPQDKPNNSNNFINAYNDRFEPPAPHGHENNVNPILPAFPGKESRLPFFPFPPGDSVESFVDLDKDPHAHLLPPTLVPPPHFEGEHPPALPVRTLSNKPQNQQDPTRPNYQPKPNNNEPRDEKHKLLEAFETLNKANYDTIQSLAADKYGPGFIDKLKTKSNMMKPEQKPVLPIRFEPLPIITTTTTTPSPKPMFNMFAVFTTKKPTAAIQDETAKLAELLKMINKPHSQAPSAQQLTSGSSMPSHDNNNNGGGNNDALANLLKSLQKATPSPTTTTTTRRPEMPSNPGLVSLTSTFNTASNDIKSLQAQLAKAIIAKAHRKNPSDELEKPHYQPLTINVAANPNENPLTVLQQLAQNRQDTVQAANAATKNYTASQIETLKKLIALNNIEQKLSNNNNDQLLKLQALFPAALKAPSPSSFPPSNSITAKMLDSSTANSNHLHGTDPTILALKALAMSKSHHVNPQPSISFPQQVKPTDPSSGPIDVDLSAILSPSPPVVEMNRKRRLTNVKNAPKSFFPANATQGFEEFSAPLWSEFHCDEQSFFPGLYADTELGCRVFHLCAKTDAGYMMKSFRCPKETVFDQEVLRCNWNLFVDCPASTKKYHFNKYLSQSFQFLKILGEFSANYQKTNDKQ